MQVGDERTEDFSRVLGYAAELVPLDNPYRWTRGATLRFRCLVDGRPAPGLTAVTGGRNPRGGRFARRELTADALGIVSLRPSGPGQWYVTFIHLGPVTAPDHDYESEWATITFELR